MMVNVNLRVTAFGQIIFEMGKVTLLPVEEQQPAPVQQEVRYGEPHETASRIYEVEYQQDIKNYFVPFSTG